MYVTCTSYTLLPKGLTGPVAPGDPSGPKGQKVRTILYIERLRGPG